MKLREISLPKSQSISHAPISQLTDSCRYEWFLETWDAYPYNIERADAIRYFVLHHYGGIYLDLDDVRILRSVCVSQSHTNWCA